MTLLGLRGHPYYFNMTAMVQFVARAQPITIPGSGPMFSYYVPEHERAQAKSRLIGMKIFMVLQILGS